MAQLPWYLSGVSIYVLWWNVVASYLRNESTNELARQVRQILYHQLKGPESKKQNKIKTSWYKKI